MLKSQQNKRYDEKITFKLHFDSKSFINHSYSFTTKDFTPRVVEEK